MGRWDDLGFELACDGYGSIPAKVMFVGISAGRRGALISKVPLTKDGSGRLFQRCLKELGLSESDEFSWTPVLKDCYITNLVKGRCLTPEGLNRLPTTEEIEYWFPRFMDEYRAVRPRSILALGSLVFREIARRGPIESVDNLPGPLALLRQVKHPRWYTSHGALSSPLSKAFLDMTLEYRMALPQ